MASAGAAKALAGAAPPAPEDLAAAAEVQITPQIQALAEELAHDPVAIEQDFLASGEVNNAEG